jgi:hypothetical protein
LRFDAISAKSARPTGGSRAGSMANAVMTLLYS